VGKRCLGYGKKRTEGEGGGGRRIRKQIYFLSFQVATKKEGRISRDRLARDEWATKTEGILLRRRGLGSLDGKGSCNSDWGLTPGFHGKRGFGAFERPTGGSGRKLGKRGTNVEK